MAFYIKSGILDKLKFKKNAVDKRLDIDINIDSYRNLYPSANYYRPVNYLYRLL